LRDIFFDELGIRHPDYMFECTSTSPISEIARILVDCERAIAKERPDRILILGDTNSGLASIVGKRNGIPVFHMEAGNRCYDDRVPEEVNRRIIDHCSDILMPYTERSRANLLREGIPNDRIFVTGNPIKEVIDYYTQGIDHSRIKKELGLSKNGYFLATLHRAENVDAGNRLKKFMMAFKTLSSNYGIPVVLSMHPRTRSRLSTQSLKIECRGIRVIEPPGFIDFIHLEKSAKCVLTDSGTVQEECCILGKPTVTLRDVTERPETIEAGSNILSGAELEDIVRCVDLVLSQSTAWCPPREYQVNSVSQTATRILLGYN
jgi:UDP-N-acetylglucosamine 2-epimerase (non-hydrolysing)